MASLKDLIIVRETTGFRMLFKYLPLFLIWNYIQPVKNFVEFVVSILLNTVFQDLSGHHLTINWSHFLSLIAYFSTFSVRECTVVRVSKQLQVPPQENIASDQNGDLGTISCPQSDIILLGNISTVREHAMHDAQPPTVP